MSLDYLCRWQVQVSVYYVWRTPVHLRCTQYSILLHLMDICFLTCSCVFVGPVFVSTLPAFMSSSASYPAGPHDRLAPKNGKSGPHCWGREVSTQFAQQFISAVTAPPFICCVVWSHGVHFFSSILRHWVVVHGTRSMLFTYCIRMIFTCFIRILLTCCIRILFTCCNRILVTCCIKSSSRVVFEYSSHVVCNFIHMVYSGTTHQVR